MKRAAIYARFSTDRQNERSIDDQFALCRACAAREGFTIVKTYADHALSGASILNRDGLLNLMDDARAGAFDVVIVEAVDRLGRDMEDLAGIHKRLKFAGIAIHAVHEGTANTVTIGLRGLVGQLQLEDNAQKIRRGMAGVIRGGRHAGGRAYGYAAVPGEPGRLIIVEAEAAIVRRIFEAYVAGHTPRAIAHVLNRDGVPAPRGPRWNASTINGNAARQCGILRNPLYAGRLAWNRSRMVKHPDTGRRVSRQNAAGEVQTTACPDLAIVAGAIYDAAQHRLARRGGPHPEHQRAPRHLFSGLLKCACGSGLASNGKDRSGRVRVRCSAHTESGTCPAPATFYLDTIERAVLAGLAAELRDPRLVSRWVKTFHEELRRLSAGNARQRLMDERRLGELARELERVIDAIAKGHGDPAVLGPRSSALAAERDNIVQRLAAAAPAPIALHPAALERYQQQIADLQTAMAGTHAHDGALAASLRELIEAVTVRVDPERQGGLIVEITGRLAALSQQQAFPDGIRTVW
jgi:site-specific DNA recombinase